MSVAMNLRAMPEPTKPARHRVAELLGLQPALDAEQTYSNLDREWLDYMMRKCRTCMNSRGDAIVRRYAGRVTSALVNDLDNIEAYLDWLQSEIYMAEDCRDRLHRAHDAMMELETVRN